MDERDDADHTRQQVDVVIKNGEVIDRFKLEPLVNRRTATQ